MKKLAYKMWSYSLALPWVLVILTVTGGCDLLDDPESPKGPGSAEVVWSHPLALPDDINGTQPYIEGEYVYVAASRRLTCYELRSGEVIWQTDLGIDQSVAGRKIISDGNTLFLNHTRWVKAFDKQTGQVLWTTSLTGFWAIRLAVMAQNETHLFLGGRGEVLRLRKSDGTIDLRIPITQLRPEGIRQSAYDPVVSADGILYVPTAYYVEGAPAIEGNLLAYDASSGAFLWGYQARQHKIPLPEYNDTLTTDAGSYTVALYENVVVFPPSVSVVTLDRHTGDKRWGRFFENEGFDVGLAVGEGVVYVGSLAQHVIALDLETGEVLWRQYTPGSITSLLTVQNGRIYFCNSAGGQLWVLEAATGRVIWHGFPPEYKNDRYATYLTPLAVGEGYMVAVGTKKVYCLTVP